MTSLALGQSYDCPSASEVTLKDLGKYIMMSVLWKWCDTKIKQSPAKPCIYFMQCTLHIPALSVDCKQDWWNPMLMGPAALATSYTGNQRLLRWRLPWQGGFETFCHLTLYLLNSFAEMLKYIFVFYMDSLKWLNVIVLGDWKGMYGSPHKRPIMLRLHIFCIFSLAKLWHKQRVASNSRSHDAHATLLKCTDKLFSVAHFLN